MKLNYYYLSISLPEIEIGKPPEFNFQQIRHYLRENLTAKDLVKTWVVRRYYDIENLRALWLGYPLSYYGNLSPVELEEFLAGNTAGAPSYVAEFLETYHSKDDRLRYFPLLVRNYFLEESAQADGFLKKYLTFEREWRLVMAAFRAKRLGRDLAVELQFEDPEEELIAQLLAQKDAKTFEPPEMYMPLKPIFEKYADDPIELHMALCKWEFNVIEKMLNNDAFSIDKILAYLVQFILAERWSLLDKQKGMQIIDTMIQEVL